MKTTKNTLIDKDYVKVRKDTFESMQNVIKETKKVMEFQPKIEQLLNEVNTFSKSHQTLEKENNNLKWEVKTITTRNQNLTNENNHLKDYYDNKDFDTNDVYDISKGTTKEDELFDYANIPNYLKTSKKFHNDRDKDDMEMSL